MLNYDSAAAFVHALTGDVHNAVVDWRAIHDTDKQVPALVCRGTLANVWSWIETLNVQGYGIFAVIAAMDGRGRHLENVAHLRANYVDLDEVSAPADYQRASSHVPAPSFAVQTSPNKFHVYWPVHPYVGNDRFEHLQRRLRQMFNGDRAVIDAARVMRVPGTLHMKNPTAPHLVAIWSLSGYGVPLTVDQLEQSVAHINLIDTGIGERQPLGCETLAAPSLEWVEYALSLVDPNDLDRASWISLTAAIKQAGWSLTDEQTLFGIWSRWCDRYSENNTGENLKQWNNIRNTEIGWQSVVNRVPSLKAALAFQMKEYTVPGAVSETPVQVGSTAPVQQPVTAPPVPSGDCSGPYLTHLEQQEYFAGCVYITNFGQIMTPDLRFLNQAQFNALYGGKYFIIDHDGKKTNEAWQAATRSILWTIPKVDHIRFVPSEPLGAIITDALGRTGVNTYKPIEASMRDGDAAPFLNHIAYLFPDPNDQKIIIEYLAHNVRYPGVKIPWAPVLQSTEGAGKGIFKKVMKHCMGAPYTYYPSAQQLAESGAKFNAWLRRKLFILVDEIRVDERRELIEVLKPLISEEEAEVQSKGVDQDIEDNFSNWCFFTNFKDAVPISSSARRFAIIYSRFQTAEDLLNFGLNKEYYDALHLWLKTGGAEICCNYLRNYPITPEQMPQRAPLTSSLEEALKLSRGPVERMIYDAIEDERKGFRKGWISIKAVLKLNRETNTVARLTATTVETIIEKMGYRLAGRTPRPWFDEDPDTRLTVYSLGGSRDPVSYGYDQGYNA